jgi:hypothetical protein
LKKQSFFPKARDMGPHNSISIGDLGRKGWEHGCYSRGREWRRHQVCRQDTFILNIYESFSSAESIGYTRQEDYIKINFWLGGRHTTVLDGFGEHEHERPEVFITAGPLDMVKIDLCGRDTHVASVALCVQRDFFPLHIGVPLDELPDPLRTIALPEVFPYAFHRSADARSPRRGTLHSRRPGGGAAGAGI